MSENQYYSFKSTLDSLGFVLESDLETFTDTQRIKFQCNGGHSNDLSKHTFYSKQKTLEREGTNICAKCNGKNKGRPKIEEGEGVVLSARTQRRRKELKGHPKEEQKPSQPPLQELLEEFVPSRIVRGVRLSKDEKYKIYSCYLESLRYTMDTEFETFSTAEKIKWTCDNGHSEEWTLDTFAAAKKKCEEQGSVLCKKCKGTKVGRPSGVTETDSAYSSYKQFLSTIDHTIVTDFDTFMSSSPKNTSRRLTFICNEGHETSLSAAVFNRKRRSYEEDRILLCNECTGRGKPRSAETKLEELKKHVFEMNGHHVIDVTDDMVVHKCGLCGEVNESWESNIRSKTTLHCRKCKIVKKETLRPPQTLVEQENKRKREAFEEKRQTILSHTGHDILREYDGKVEYRCVNCGDIRTNTYKQLVRPSATKFCSNCSERNVKKTLDVVIESFEQLKLEEPTLEDYQILNYETNKCVTFKCSQGHEFTTAYYALKRGRRCPQCSGTRRASTNLEKYGAANPFGSDVIKEKIKETCQERYGKSHHMKVASIREKAEKTNLEKIGVRFAFNQQHVFEQIQKTHMEKYGCKFPLQSKFIQAKISMTFLEKIGVSRPMRDQELWKKWIFDKYGVDHYSKTDQFKIDYVNTCMDRYGVDHYSKTDQFKIDFAETCMARYGVDHYSKTDQFKIDYAKTCMDRYGVDHPMKTVEIFSKATSSSFRRKAFIFPSGRTEYVMGYEPYALRELLNTYKEEDIITNVWCIPTFDYERVSSKARPLKEEGKIVQSKYFPDILLPDKIIEVKSTYLYEQDKINVIKKLSSCAESGYLSELWVYKTANVIDFKMSFECINGVIITTIIQ